MTGLHKTEDEAAEPAQTNARSLAQEPPSPDDVDERARQFAARYADFLARSPRLAAAWRAFRTASPATRAEAEYELRCLEEEVGGDDALTMLREAAEREACRSYRQRLHGLAA